MNTTILFIILFFGIMFLFMYILYLLYKQRIIQRTLLQNEHEIKDLSYIIRKTFKERDILVETEKSLLNDIKTLNKKIKQEQSKTKSTEIRTGLIMEKMTPFMDVFHYNPSNAHFLGQPIDYIVFTDKEIIFVEVKTGKSKMSPTQNKIKNIIEKGNIRFELIRFSEN